MTYSPYENGYGLRWPSSSIVSDLYNNINRVGGLQRGMDFGCGLGPHGRLLETIGFREIFYVDKDFAALEAAKKFLRDLPFSGSRSFYSSIAKISKTTKFDVIVDRASLQHVDKGSLPNVLSHMASMLLPTESERKSQGLLISEWIVSSTHSSQVERFPNITFFNEIHSLLEAKFEFLKLTYHTFEQIYEGEVSNSKVANLVLTSRQQ